MNLGSIRDLRVSNEGEGLSHATVTMAKRSVKIIQITPRRTPSLETLEIPPNVLKVFKTDFITLDNLIYLFEQSGKTF